MKERLQLMERCLDLVRLARRKGESGMAKAAIDLELEFGRECERLREAISRETTPAKEGEVAA
jgi:hypothetical protein